MPLDYTQKQIKKQPPFSLIFDKKNVIIFGKRKKQ